MYSKLDRCHCKSSPPSSDFFFDHKVNKGPTINQTGNNTPCSSLSSERFHIYIFHLTLERIVPHLQMIMLKAPGLPCVLTTSRKWARDQTSDGIWDVYITQHGNSCLNARQKYEAKPFLDIRHSFFFFFFS